MGVRQEILLQNHQKYNGLDWGRYTLDDDEEKFLQEAMRKVWNQGLESVEQKGHYPDHVLFFMVQLKEFIRANKGREDAASGLFVLRDLQRAMWEFLDHDERLKVMGSGTYDEGDDLRSFQSAWRLNPPEVRLGDAIHVILAKYGYLYLVESFYMKITGQAGVLYDPNRLAIEVDQKESYDE